MKIQSDKACQQYLLAIDHPLFRFLQKRELKKSKNQYRGNNVRLHIILTMPQLLPFYFVNQLSFAFLVLITLVYVFGTYILPAFVELFVTRMYITKL